MKSIQTWIHPCLQGLHRNLIKVQIRGSEGITMSQHTQCLDLVIIILARYWLHHSQLHRSRALSSSFVGQMHYMGKKESSDTHKSSGLHTNLFRI